MSKNPSIRKTNNDGLSFASLVVIGVFIFAGSCGSGNAFGVLLGGAIALFGICQLRVCRYRQSLQDVDMCNRMEKEYVY